MGGGVMRAPESWLTELPNQNATNTARTPPDSGNKVAECNVCTDTDFCNCIEPTGARAMTSVIRFPLQLAYTKSQDDRQAESEFRVRDRFRNTPLPAGGDTFDKIVARLLVARCYMLCDSNDASAY